MSMYMWGVRECVLVCWWSQVCVGVSGWVCAGMRRGDVLVCAGVYRCVRDEFSEYLLETRFLTSANYNPHPLPIFIDFTWFHPKDFAVAIQQLFPIPYWQQQYSCWHGPKAFKILHIGFSATTFFGMQT